MNVHTQMELEHHLSNAEIHYSDVSGLSPKEVEASPILTARREAFRSLLDTYNKALGREAPLASYPCFRDG
jgi:hypothetical protein